MQSSNGLKDDLAEAGLDSSNILFTQSMANCISKNTNINSSAGGNSLCEAIVRRGKDNSVDLAVGIIDRPKEHAIHTFIACFQQILEYGEIGLSNWLKKNIDASSANHSFIGDIVIQIKRTDLRWLIVTEILLCFFNHKSFE